MWVCLLGYIPYYYRLGSGILQVFDADHSLTWRQSLNDMLKGSWVKDLIPLPNIEIPWEATEDSVSPVADGTHIIAKEACGYTHQIKANSNNLYWNTKPITGNQIVSYKIIDEEYLPKEDEHLKEEEDDPAIEALVEHLSKEEQKAQVIKNLEFLQILANKFPEIKDKVVELMEVELDAWWHGTFEENNDD